MYRLGFVFVVEKRKSVSLSLCLKQLQGGGLGEPRSVCVRREREGGGGSACAHLVLKENRGKLFFSICSTVQLGLSLFV